MRACGGGSNYSLGGRAHRRPTHWPQPRCYANGSRLYKGEGASSPTAPSCPFSIHLSSASSLVRALALAVSDWVWLIQDECQSADEACCGVVEARAERGTASQSRGTQLAASRRTLFCCYGHGNSIARSIVIIILRLLRLPQFIAPILLHLPKRLRLDPQELGAVYLASSVCM